MAYVPNTDNDRKVMFDAIGVEKFDDLIANIPDEIRLKSDLNLPPQLSELEALTLLKSYSAKNISTDSHICFMGGGAYDHYIPAMVGSVLERPEYKTAYTPYQAEVSQGTLQVMYEYQSCITSLTGMDVSNASQYDGGSALAEACMLAQAQNHRTEVIFAGTINPNYVTVANTITVGLGLHYKTVKNTDGICDLDLLKSTITDKTAAVVVSQPNFLGSLEDVRKIEEICHSVGAMYIVVVNPLSLGLLEAPGNYNADIVLGEGQPLGIPLNFGGPYLGFFAIKKEYLRKMPGRVCGVTEDNRGNRAFVLTLQTREQQIKREKATSNICTNQGLMMLASTVYMETMGKEGIRETAEQAFHKAHYLAKKISEIPGYNLANNHPFFNEFLIETPVPACKVITEGINNGFLPGINVSDFIPEQNGLLIAVTEKRSKEQLDKFVEFLRNIA
jgi:glycine dehydrogenase subunit 1